MVGCMFPPHRLPDPAGSAAGRSQDPGRGSLWNVVIDLGAWSRREEEQLQRGDKHEEGTTANFSVCMSVTYSRSWTLHHFYTQRDENYLTFCTVNHVFSPSCLLHQWAHSTLRPYFLNEPVWWPREIPHISLNMVPPWGRVQDTFTSQSEVTQHSFQCIRGPDMQCNVSSNVTGTQWHEMEEKMRTYLLS